MAKEPAETFNTSLKQYFNADAFSDAVILCNGKEFKVHKLVLSAQSKFFAKMFTGDWKENTAGLIELEEDDDSVLEAVLRFMYYFDYNNVHGVSTMIFNAQVYSLADKYMIPALKGLAEEKFRTAITIGWAMDDFPLAVAEVYSSTPEDDRGLRDLAVEVARTNVESLVQDEQFRSLLKESPCFAADLVISMSSNKDGNLHTYKCRNCSRKMDVAFSEGSSYYCIHCGSRRSDWKVFDDGTRSDSSR